MKKFFLFSFFIFSFSFSKAQWVTIPDANFVAWLQTNYPSCMNGNLMDTTCSGIVNATSLTCSYQNISDFSGIEYFNSLQAFNCDGNGLTSLPPLQNSITWFSCSSNSLSSLPPLPNSLTNFWCDVNLITSLPALPNSITLLHCEHNLLVSLPNIPTSLTQIFSSFNSLTSLPALSTSLTYLDCYHNSLTALPALPNTLTDIDCRNNSLTSLPALPNSLTDINCDNNLLTSLPSLPNSLETLGCTNNFLTSIPALPNSLKILLCSNNQLTSLPTLSNSLITLGCSYNQITNLPTLPITLINLVCPFNPGIIIPALPDSLEWFSCGHNQLTSLPSLPESLTALDCNNNLLASLPALPISGNSFGLICDHNLLTNLPLFSDSIGDLYLNCGNNQLTSFPILPQSISKFLVDSNANLFCLPVIQNFYGYSDDFRIEGTGITCLPGIIQHIGYIASIDTLPICDVFNSNGCEVYWNILGNVVFDGDSNCATTNDGYGIDMVKMNLYDAGNNLLQQVFANWDGDYSFDTQLGNYSASIDTVYFPFTALCPTSNSIISNFNAVDSIDYNVDFRLACKSGYDLGVWGVVPWSNFFPGDTTPIHVFAGDFAASLSNGFCNSGNISGEVKIIINNPSNYLSPISGALTPTMSGDTMIYSIADFSLLNAYNDLAFYAVTDTTAQIGDQVCINVIVTPSVNDYDTSNNSLTNCFEVNNSFDPNEKEVSPPGGLEFPFDDFLTYTIHFQNTGTAAAQHIQILDTLDSDLDESTFQLLSSSFDPMVQLFGNKVHFNFVNINLPDSASSPEASKGYVSYRIKPKQNLAIGTQIENTASIYFDFNSPVVTNTTLNTIIITGVNELAVGNLQLTVYPNPFSCQLAVDSRQLAGATLSVTDIFGREVLRVKPNLNSQIINLKSLSTGIYFLKLQLPDGNFAVKKIVKE